MSYPGINQNGDFDSHDRGDRRGCSCVLAAFHICCVAVRFRGASESASSDKPAAKGRSARSAKPVARAPVALPPGGGFWKRVGLKTMMGAAAGAPPQSAASDEEPESPKTPPEPASAKPGAENPAQPPEKPAEADTEKTAEPPAAAEPESTADDHEGGDSNEGHEGDSGGDGHGDDGHGGDGHGG